MAVARSIQRLQRDLSSAVRVIDELVRENYELREQVNDLVNRNLSETLEHTPRPSTQY